MKNTLAILLTSILAVPAFSDECRYQTVAGSPVTFRGEGVPATQSLFYQPKAIAAGSDGSIYVADTGNNRVRRIAPDGMIQTIAGTGEQGFAGDGGPAIQAALNQPAGLALAVDGTLYISDTSNHRVRAISANGTIRTVAGEGHARFAGDGGKATAASLNLPTGLAVDRSGNLFIVDSWNNRVRRVGTDGLIRTVAGSQGRDDYNTDFPCCQPAQPTQPGTGVALYGSISVAAGSGGELYISDLFALHRLDTNGQLSTMIFYSGRDQPVASSTAIASLKIASALPATLPDGSLVLVTLTEAVRIAGGSASPLSVSNPAQILHVVADPSTGALVTLGSPVAPTIQILPYAPTIQRVSLNGTASTVYTNPLQSDPSKAASVFDLDLGGPEAVAIGPDHTIFIGESNAGRIIAIAPGGQVSTVAILPWPVGSLAVDSHGNVYASALDFSEVQKIPRGGAPQHFFFGKGRINAIRLDAQDRLYVFETYGNEPLVRVDPDGTKTIVLGNLVQGTEVFPTYLKLPMAVAADGTAYVPADPFLGILKVSPVITEFPSRVHTERQFFPNGMALSASGDLYLSAQPGIVYKVTSDGTLLTVFGGDGYDFWGENGNDSARETPSTQDTDLAIDGQNLYIIDPASATLKKIALDSCTPVPTPSIGGIVESATSNLNLKLAAGQLVSIYGLRLGPAAGALTQFDSTGHLPKTASGTQVTFNDIAAPLLYVSATQVNAIVPFDLAGQQPVRIGVTNDGLKSDVFPSQIANYGPAIFSYPVPTSGLYASMLNQDGKVNSAANPAKLGTIVTIFATGVGATNPAGNDGAVSVAPYKTPAQPVTIQVEDQTTVLTYAGNAPGEVEGVLQFNLRLPETLPGRGGDSAFIKIEMGNGVPGPSRDILFYFTP